MEAFDKDVRVEIDCKVNTRTDDPLCAVVFQDMKLSQRMPKSPVSAFTAWKVFEVPSGVHLIKYPKETGLEAEIFFPDSNKTVLLPQFNVKPGSKWIIVEASESSTNSSTGEDRPSSVVVMREGDLSIDCVCMTLYVCSHIGSWII